MPSANLPASAISRDLPTPVSPTNSTSAPDPRFAASIAERRDASSRARPTSGTSIRIAASDAPRTGSPTSQACTGRALPLTANGSSAACSKLVLARRRTSRVAYT
jgi:hypothetical protein